MTTRILLAPISAGKTEYVLTQLVDTLQAQPFAKVWALLATRRQEDAFRQRLVDFDSGRRVFFNVEYFNFYALYQRILDMQGNPQRELSDAARFALLRSIVLSLQDELQLFGSIAHTPGFIRIVAEFIYELKQRRIYPEVFQDAALTARDHDLARIYTAYQQALRDDELMDREGQGWLAVDALTNDRELAGDLSLLIVDGFDQFTPVQAELLRLLADRSADALITLTRVPESQKTVGRRFERALNLLRAKFEALSVPHEEHVIDADSGDHRHPDLDHLVHTVFIQNAAQQATSGGVMFLSAPDFAGEVGLVLREVKRLLLDGISPDDILIALRDWENYRPHFTALMQKYDLPLALHYGEPLDENPALIMLLNLLQLRDNYFKRLDVLDVLGSQYLDVPGIGPDEVALLDRISRVGVVTAGRESWLQAVADAGLPRVDYDHDEMIPPILPADSTLYDALATFFDAVTPPPEATVAEYVLWLETLMGADPQINLDDETFPQVGTGYSLNMIACLRDETVSDRIRARDIAAMSAFKRVLRGLIHAQQLLASMNFDADQPVNWETFKGDLLRGVASASVNPRPNRAGRVLVTTAADARGLPHRQVFILGLSEGLFPAKTPEDPLYLDTERRRLQQAGIPLQTRAERSADDGLFYELISLPRERLILSRPTLQEGKPWAESPLWRAAAAVFSDSKLRITEREQKIAAVVPVESAVSIDEVVLAVAESLNSGQPDWASVVWLQDQASAHWSHVQAGRRIEAERLTGWQFDKYSGRLRDETLIDLIARRLSPARVWSASQMNDYGVCGFRFFARRLLRLEALEEPEEGMNAAQRGTLIHAILEQTYRAVGKAKLDIQPENLDAALTLLHDAASAVFADAPERYAFRQSALWEYEQKNLLDGLTKFIQRDFDGKPINKNVFSDAIRQPYLLEQAFGGDDAPVWIDLGEGVGKIRVRGFIDRIDRQGQQAIVIDYKSGSSNISKSEMEAGRNFQMMVYLEGAQAILARQNAALAVQGGTFWHCMDSNVKTSGAIRLDEEGQAALDLAKQHLADHIAAGRRGDFAVHASRPNNGKCVSYCEFHQFCRASITHRRKR